MDRTVCIAENDQEHWAAADVRLKPADLWKPILSFHD
jgi:hypothetical protein